MKFQTFEEFLKTHSRLKVRIQKSNNQLWVSLFTNRFPAFFTHEIDNLDDIWKIIPESIYHLLRECCSQGCEHLNYEVIKDANNANSRQ